MIGAKSIDGDYKDMNPSMSDLMRSIVPDDRLG